MLDRILTRKASVTAPSAPPMSRVTSSPSSPFTASNDGSRNVASLSPVTTHHDDDHHRHSRVPERSLRQRGTTSAVPSQSSAALIIPRDEDESLSNFEDDDTKGGNSSSVLRSVLGASPFLMGPHIFSTSEILQPPRARKGSCENNDLQTNVDISPSSKKSILHRRGVPQTPLMASPSSSTHGSSSSDGDLESGDYPLDESLVSSSTRRRQPSNSYQKKYAFVLRSREDVVINLLIQMRMLRVDLLFISFATFWQFFHSAVTNVAYWQHAQLNAANRVPLQDVAFDLLPVLDGDLWIISEYFFWVILAVSISCIISTLFVKWNAPHGRPIFCMQIMRRMGMTLVSCMTLRMISFLVTTLPGASRQCRYSVPDGLSSADMLNGPAPNEGNPSGWAPPTDIYDILFRFDAANGCGDLMFSSHTVFTMTLTCIVFKYFNFKWLKLVMVLAQIAIVPFILAARKHYTVDVFTALYVVPLVFEFLWARFPDRDSSTDLAKYYGIHYYLAQVSNDSFSYVVSVWGREFVVDPDQLPFDINQARHNVKGFALPRGKGGDNARSTASIV